MIEKSKKTDILILRGVFIDDFLGKPLDISKKPLINYSNIPSKFTSVEEWPELTNLKCWECDRLVTGRPKFIPINCKKTANDADVCNVLGNFDEWSCAVRYVMTQMPPDQRYDLLQAIYIYEAKFSGKKKLIIHPSPPKILMKTYCGNAGLTPEEYQKKIDDLYNEIR